MPMDTERYCATLDKLDPAEAIRAIHAAHMRLLAVGHIGDVADNRDALERLRACLAVAGHPAGDVKASEMSLNDWLARELGTRNWLVGRKTPRKVALGYELFLTEKQFRDLARKARSEGVATG